MVENICVPNVVDLRELQVSLYNKHLRKLAKLISSFNCARPTFHRPLFHGRNFFPKPFYLFFDFLLNLHSSVRARSGRQLELVSEVRTSEDWNTLAECSRTYTLTYPYSRYICRGQTNSNWSREVRRANFIKNLFFLRAARWCFLFFLRLSI